MDAAGKRPANKPWRPSSANRSQEASKVPIASSADADDIASSLSSLSLGHNQPSRLGTIPSGSSSVVLELIDIPSSYKTSDLVDIFKKFDSPMDFTIKWLTDTQARAIFKSPSLAKSAYLQTCNNSSFKISIGASSAPATHSFSPETPGLTTSSPRNSTLSSSRPVTTDLIARRLVAGALGLKLERREGGKDLKESQKIQQVREKRDEEKKRLEQREQDLSAAWDE